MTCEVSLEEASNVPIPKGEEHQWNKISHREIRVTLFDFSSGRYLSNAIILSVQWNPQYETKWLVNSPTEKTFLINSSYESATGVNLLMELVVYVPQSGGKDPQQITCAYGKVNVTDINKNSKVKIDLEAGNPFVESEFDMKAGGAKKKGFAFIKKQVNDVQMPSISMTVKPSQKLTET
jgi:hypothetical protein